MAYEIRSGISATGLNKIYKILSERYGPQGWWPLRSRRMTAGAELQDTLGFNSSGYHPGIVHHPAPDEIFEIATGAVLTQNTNWKNASAAIDNLLSAGKLSPDSMNKMKTAELAAMIRPSGYFNQKAIKLRLISNLFLEHKLSAISRETLLSIWGIGPETADSILLYGFDQPHFVIDAYTRRIFSRYFADHVVERTGYEGLKQEVEQQFACDAETWREFHALIVIHAKKFCTKKPQCTGCPLIKSCNREK